MKSSFLKSKSLFLFEDTKNISFLIHGQGVFIFKNTDNSKPCKFWILNDNETDGFSVDFKVDSIKINRLTILDPLLDPDNKFGLNNNDGVYYWVSLDSQNQRFFAGIGEPRIETTCFKYQYNFTSERDDLRKTNKLFLESLTKIKILDDSTAIVPLKLLRDPITRPVSLLIKNTNNLTMEDIALGKYLPKANLSPIAEKLFDCISGENFKLNTPDFPDFTKAIEYSIITPGKWCYEKLKEKATEFDKDKPNPNETYLRITLAENNGESPGIPYVMEIWPPGNYSPIHNHGGSHAIIKVLSGNINVKLFPFLSGDQDVVPPFAESNFGEGDITWLSDSLNQIHKLTNEGKETCITIQCYMYESDNISHYDFFDYLQALHKISQFEPNSDSDFIKFKNIIKDEFTSYKNNKSFCSLS